MVLKTHISINDLLLSLVGLLYDGESVLTGYLVKMEGTDTSYNWKLCLFNHFPQSENMLDIQW